MAYTARFDSGSTGRHQQGSFEPEPGQVRQSHRPPENTLARHQADLRVAAVVAVPMVRMHEVMARRDDTGRDRFKRPPIKGKRLGAPDGLAVHPHHAVPVHRDSRTRKPANGFQIRHVRAQPFGRFEHDPVTEFRRPQWHHEIPPRAVRPTGVDVDPGGEQQPHRRQRHEQRQDPVPAGGHGRPHGSSSVAAPADPLTATGANPQDEIADRTSPV